MPTPHPPTSGTPRVAVVNVVGLTPDLLPHLPRLRAFAERGAVTPVAPMLPAVTCSVQATYLTGEWPSTHGIVGNGWYFKDECEIKFWRQSNHLIQSPKLWDALRAHDPSATIANVCWWYNMYSSADYTVTPRPMYPADGRKLPDCYTQPMELRDDLQAKLGTFPLFSYWGPNANITSSAWIAEAAKYIDAKYAPTLNLVYLPHLDYGLQQHGPDPAALTTQLAEIDGVAGDLIEYYERRGVQVMVVSEYGIERAWRPVHINRALREAGLISVRREVGHELLDAGTSAAFAVADHQVAHVYVNDPTRAAEVRALLEALPGVAEVLDEGGKRRHHLDHDRAGDFVVIAESGAWFTYYYWLDDAVAPDYARTVDIHRKPGYDPVELFMDPHSPAKLNAGVALLKKKLGFRYLLNVIGLDASLVQGAHGRVGGDPAEGPLLITDRPELLPRRPLVATDVYTAILAHLGVQVPQPV
ncbi:putative AlkP superfamily pyrophosphatase or phosphodiesterase [Deinococcus metalli]|uniref:Alkaline phosphatase family protein n=1 Tax=Deinococcus metalli TaxID=1141878 RepID=A0A7W8KCF6_9DEIO|nr:nucleotide pyrophosphatase/phosphodiesterase family protein [Deinococcus metalli]MBB5375632.1 putative AlkP superfamily pyrophosphatase or phosphodiesterase [Deinococcus metalli]GHF38225.1 alkaline phosphatase family protein [Deinococcus metalli]